MKARWSAQGGTLSFHMLKTPELAMSPQFNPSSAYLSATKPWACTRRVTVRGSGRIPVVPVARVHGDSLPFRSSRACDAGPGVVRFRSGRAATASHTAQGRPRG